MSLEEKFFKMVEHNLEHFKIIIRGEFVIESENTNLTYDFEVESNHINTALKKLGKEINITMLKKAKDIIKDLMVTKK